MELSGLLTSLGINMGICALLFGLYSVMRKQPSNKGVYFARSLALARTKSHDPHWFDRFVPSTRWILQAWQLTDSEIMKIGGLDAVVFVKTLVFSIRIFSIASIICLFLVLPLNYYGKDIVHKRIDSESMEVFTIENIEAGSRWLWAHCLALYIICFSAGFLLYVEYKDVAKLRMEHLHGSVQNPSHFAVLVRGIPCSPEENFSDSLTECFEKYYPTSYISHHMVYRCGNVVKLMKKAEKMYNIFSIHCNATQCVRCNSCVRQQDLDKAKVEKEEKSNFGHDTQEPPSSGKETGAAFVFFKTRYDAATVARTHQSSNPTLWVTSSAPEPSDVYWPNLCVPYSQLWVRRIATLAATAAFLIFFLFPVTFVQGLANLNRFQRAFPFLRGLLLKPAVEQLVTGYLPSVILLLFLLMVPPLMMMFSTIEGYISRSGRKKATCLKVLYFNILNVYFFNLVSGTVVNHYSVLSHPLDIPEQLANRAVPALFSQILTVLWIWNMDYGKLVHRIPSSTSLQLRVSLATTSLSYGIGVKFFMTYVMTSGWTSLAIELVQLFPVSINSIYKWFSGKKSGPFDEGYTFPFHTEVPRVLLFVLLGFNFAVLAPLILPLLLIYFCLAYFVYRNQIFNVYLFEYDTGGQYWPIVHNTTIFSMVLAQIMALGVFVTKESTVCIAFTALLMICTLLFYEYCRQRFLPVFKDIPSQELIEMDQEDEETGRQEIYKQLQLAYAQHDWVSYHRNEQRNTCTVASNTNSGTLRPISSGLKGARSAKGIKPLFPVRGEGKPTEEQPWPLVVVTDGGRPGYEAEKPEDHHHHAEKPEDENWETPFLMHTTERAESGGNGEQSGKNS